MCLSFSHTLHLISQKDLLGWSSKLYPESHQYLLLSPYHHHLSSGLLHQPPNCFLCCCPSLPSIVYFQYSCESSQVWLLLCSETFSGSPFHSVKSKVIKETYKTPPDEFFLILSPSHYLFNTLVLSTYPLPHSTVITMVSLLFFFLIATHTLFLKPLLYFLCFLEHFFFQISTGLTFSSP